MGIAEAIAAVEQQAAALESEPQADAASGAASDVADGAPSGGAQDGNVDLPGAGDPKGAKPAENKPSIAEKHAAALKEMRARWQADKARKEREARERSEKEREAAWPKREEEIRKQVEAEIAREFAERPVATAQRMGIAVSKAYRAFTDEILEEDKPVPMTRAQLRELEASILAKAKAESGEKAAPDEVRALREELQRMQHEARIAKAQSDAQSFLAVVQGEAYESLYDDYGDEALLRMANRLIDDKQTRGEPWTPETLAAELNEIHNSWKADGERRRAARAARRPGAQESAGTHPAREQPSGPASAKAKKPAPPQLSQSLASQTSSGSKHGLTQAERMERLARQLDAAERMR